MGAIYFLVILGLCFIHQSNSINNRPFGFRRRSNCQPLKIQSCRKLGYNQTRSLDDMYPSMPLPELQQYIKLLDKIQCSKDLLFFLCTIYSPVCFAGYAPRVLPCRSVCERVKKGCLPYVQLAGFSWPSELDCGKLPEYNTGVCIRPSAIVPEEGNRRKSPNREVANLTCPKCKPRDVLRRYKQFKRADYVIEAEVKSRITTAKKETKLIVFIKKVYKQGRAKISTGFKRLLSPTRCVCPKIEFDKSYVIFGQEDRRRGKLIFDYRAIIRKSSRQLSKRLLRWKLKYMKHQQRKFRKNNPKV